MIPPKIVSRSLWLLLACGWVLLGLKCRAGAIEPALIGGGDVWTFQPGFSALPANWKEPGFDDSSWRRGPSGLGLSYRGENTLFLGIPRGYVTMYFRREFQVADPEEIGALTLRLDWHGGIVAYLNGTEFYRFGLGPRGSAVTHTNFGGLRIAGAAEDLPVPNFRELLRPGTNTLAIEAHLTNPLFDIVLVPELLANFSRGPYVQNPVSGSLDILWRTPLVGPARVEYGLSEALGAIAPAQMQQAYSFARLEGIAPGSTCFYRVVVDTELGTFRSPTCRCRALPASGPITALLFGDSGTGSRSQFAVADELRRQSASADVVVHLGDIVYPDFSVEQADIRCLSIYRESLRRLPSFFTWGNHDLPFGSGPFRSAFRMPTNSTPSLEHLAAGTEPDFYYSFDAGDAHFAVVSWPWNYIYAMRPDSPQARWLDADLAGSGKRWKFVCLHHPVNTSSAHRFDDYDDNGLADRLEVQQVLLPIAAKHGVRMIFSGHDHAFERFQPVNRISTVVTGGGGAELYGLSERDTNSAAFYLRWHLSRLEVAGDSVRLSAWAADGTPIDSVEFRDSPADSTDRDGDGLGDLAEELTGANPDRPDTDGDGLPDGWEFLRGMDPARPSVVPATNGTVGPGDPRLIAEVLAEPIPRPATQLRVHPLPDGRIQLRWLGMPGMSAQIESALTAEGPYAEFPELPARALANDRQAAELNVGTSNRFYRVRLIAP